jgi:lipopolysaccharide transport system ATP-binding protein
MVEGLSKRYRIGARERGKRDLRETVAAVLSAPLRRLRSFGRSSHREEDSIWALRDVSFEVARGEVLGIIGPNGAGKTTLLKVLSRITEPTSGRAVLEGRTASLLEVGTGFHLELTGRENICLSGAILGMRKSEIDAKFDEIVEFSGVERFLDTPVKRYSSGMRVRLGFAVAAHLDPEILLVDEVLAVGDARFQRRSVGKMRSLSGVGRTVLFVSHRLESIVQLCSRAVWLDGGRVAQMGPAEEVVQAYLHASMDASAGEEGEETVAPDAPARLVRVECVDMEGRPCRVFRMGGPLTIRIEYEVRRPMTVGLGVSIGDLYGRRVFGSNAPRDGHAVERGPGAYRAEFFVPRLLLAPGDYYLTSGVQDALRGEMIHRCDPAMGFEVLAADMAGAGSLVRPSDGAFWMDHEWRV